METKPENIKIGELVREILAGNHESFRGIVVEYGPDVRAFIARGISDPHTVDDLTQETFIAVYQSLDKFDDKLPMAPWIRSIARNKLLMHLREFYRHRGKVEAARSEILERFVVEPDDGMDEEPDQISRLKLCLEKLPLRSRETLDARYLRKESVTSLAEKLKTTVSAISSLLYHARGALRTCMEKGIS